MTNILISEFDSNIGDRYWSRDVALYPKNYFWPHSLQENGLFPADFTGRVCLNDPEILRLVIEAVYKITTDKVITIGYADVNSWCDCPICRTKLASQTLIEFVNEVVRQFPEKQFATLAYYKTEEPPTIKPLPNVEIIITTIEIPKNEPYLTSNRADVVEWRRRLLKWLKLNPNVTVWDYYANLRHLLMSYPVLLQIAPNIRWFKSLGITNFIFQCNFNTGHEFSEVKKELIAGGNLNTILIKRYGICLFPYVRRYIDLLAKYQKLGKWCIIYADPSEFRNSFLSDKALAEYTWLLNRKGLEEVYLQVLYAKLELDIATPKDKQRFVEICEKLGEVTVNESHLSWRDFVKTK